MAAIKRPRETRNGRFWMLIELKKSCIGESDAGNQTPFTATKPRNARTIRANGGPMTVPDARLTAASREHPPPAGSPSVTYRARRLGTSPLR